MKLLMCPRHWRLVPALIQRRVWTSYRDGQELDGNLSEEYLAAARAAVNAVERKEGRQSVSLPWELV